jgi:hypothetical protein
MGREIGRGRKKDNSVEERDDSFGSLSRSLSITPKESKNPHAFAGMTPGTRLVQNNNDEEKGLEDFYRDASRTTFQINNKTLLFSKERKKSEESEDSEDRVLVYSNPEEFKKILKGELLDQYSNFLRHYSQGPGASVCGRCFFYFLEHKIEFDETQLQMAIIHEEFDPKLRPGHIDIKINFIDGVVSLETTELICCNQLFPGYPMTGPDRRCHVKTVAKLTPDGFDITWETQQPLILQALKGGKTSLMAFTDTAEKQQTAQPEPIFKVVQPSRLSRFKEKCGQVGQAFKELPEKWKALPTKWKVLTGAVLFVGAAAIVVGGIVFPPSLAVTLPVVGKITIPAATVTASLVYGGIALCGVASLGHLGHTLSVQAHLTEGEDKFVPTDSVDPSHCVTSTPRRNSSTAGRLADGRLKINPATTLSTIRVEETAATTQRNSLSKLSPSNTDSGLVSREERRSSVSRTNRQ